MKRLISLIGILTAIICTPSLFPFNKGEVRWGSGVVLAANGSVIRSMGSIFDVKLLDAQSASHSGVWVDLSDCKEKTLHANQIESGGKAEIMARNDQTKPTDATDGVVLITLDNTTLAGLDNGRWHWIKAKKTAGGTPVATTLIMEGC